MMSSTWNWLTAIVRRIRYGATFGMMAAGALFPLLFGAAGGGQSGAEDGQGEQAKALRVKKALRVMLVFMVSVLLSMLRLMGRIGG